MTTVAQHFIPTSGNPIKVPPRRIPANYRAEAEEQLTTMLERGIIEESSSIWMAPAVFVRKNTGKLRICVDYRELNKRTVTDAYPLPCLDEVPDRLSGSTVFSTLDLASGYWQLPVHPEDWPKNCFLPWSRNGTVPVHTHAFWSVRCTCLISTPHGQGVSRTSLRYHLP